MNSNADKIGPHPLLSSPVFRLPVQRQDAKIPQVNL